MAISLRTIIGRVIAWTILGNALFVGISDSVIADDYKIKYTYDSSVNRVLTNVGDSNAIPNAYMGTPRGESTYMKKAAARKKQAQKRKAGAVKNGNDDLKSAKGATTVQKNVATANVANNKNKKNTSSQRLASAPAGNTVVKRYGNNLKIRTLPKDGEILPAPKIEYVYPDYGNSSSYAYAGDNWAFATFDAKKRSPRLVRFYGNYTNAQGQTVRGWHEIDINPLILQASKAAGVDPLLVEIIIRHESNFNPYAVSPAGAVGMMQLMPDTAGGLGISDVYNIRDNIRGGAQYIAYQLAQFHSVPLALAAYNAGPGAVLEYGGVPPYAETQYYVNTIYGEYLAGVRYREKHR